jgi:hypothetical protein
VAVNNMFRTYSEEDLRYFLSRLKSTAKMNRETVYLHFTQHLESALKTQKTLKPFLVPDPFLSHVFKIRVGAVEE